MLLIMFKIYVDHRKMLNMINFDDHDCKKYKRGSTTKRVSGIEGGLPKKLSPLPPTIFNTYGVPKVPRMRLSQNIVAWIGAHTHKV